MPGIECFKADFNVGAVVPKDFEIQAISQDVKMQEPTEIDLTTMVVSNPPGSTTSVMVVTRTGANNTGLWDLNAGILTYISDLRTGPVEATVTIRCTDDTTGAFIEKDETLTINLTDTYSDADIKTIVMPEITTACAFHNAINGETSFSFASYTFQSLHNLFCGTCDIDYWNEFRSCVDNVIGQATETFTTDGATAPSCSGLTGSPQAALGATQATYAGWPTCPATKSLRMFAMSSLHFLYDIICNNPCGFAPTTFADPANPSGPIVNDMDWALVTYQWIRLNIVERLFTTGGNLQSGIRTLSLAAVTQTQGVGGSNPSHATGYWSSQTMLQLIVAMLDDKIRQCLGAPQYPYQALTLNVNDPLNPASWDSGTLFVGNYIHQNTMVVPAADITIGKFDYNLYFRWWVASTTTDGSGNITWDVGNPNIQAGTGFGNPGEHKAPDTDHSWRIVRMAQLMVDLGCVGVNDPYIDRDLAGITPGEILERIGNNFAQNICLDDTENCLRFANYIDGTDTIYRALTHAGGGVDGMASHTWGWYRGAYTNNDAMKCINRLLCWTRNEPNLSSGDPCYGGTYQVHNTAYGIPHLYGALYDIQKRRGNN